MKKVTVTGEKGYEILIGEGLLDRAGDYVRQVSKAGRAIVISDSNVFPLYGKVVCDSLKTAGFETSSFVFPAGEPSKTLATVSDMVGAMCDAELTRGDIAIALGGGVTGDMVGFASAMYLRGIDFVQIPTTLLSQVDSSVGGKTGCDLSYGKNLIGAFHNPKLVLIDPETLRTLPRRYLNDGMGEIVKYGAIKSESLFQKLEQCDAIGNILDEIIYACVDIKREVVENDFTEKGERMLLNFGHTLAHAIEKHYNYEGLSHGEAVGVGMVRITQAAERVGLTQNGCAERIEKLLQKFGLPTDAGVAADRLIEIMLHDKKRRGDTLNLVLLHEIGRSYVEPFAKDALGDFFAEV